MAGYQGNIEESKDSQSKDDSHKKPEDTCLMVETSEITLVPNNVKVSPKRVSEGDIRELRNQRGDSPSNLNGKALKLKKQLSAPAGQDIHRKNGYPTTAVFDNPAYEDDERLSTNPSFADVVSQLITEPIAEDIHPYGRGHLYATAFHWELPKIHRDEGSLFLWFLATAVVLGLVFSVIFMSLMYESSSTQENTDFTTQALTVNTT